MFFLNYILNLLYFYKLQFGISNNGGHGLGKGQLSIDYQNRDKINQFIKAFGFACLSTMQLFNGEDLMSHR